MLDHQETLEIDTPGRARIEVTRAVEDVVARSGVGRGLCSVFCHHTSAGLSIQENADPSVGDDTLSFLERLAPDGDPAYTHTAEGPDDMAAHLRTTLTRTSESIPIRDGRLALGRWQGLYLLEHRTSPHRRTLTVSVLGAGD